MRWYNIAEGKRIPRKKGQPANSKKHSDLYTDENPKGTIHGLGFKDEATARSSVSKIRKSGRSHAHKIQAAVAMEQRAKAAGKSGPASIYRKYINSMKKKTKQKNEEAAGVGIVTKQNATKDVPVGGEYMNVKKLHLGKGKPKEHPKKTKGSKTNVLFNLGMAESEKDIKYTKPNLDHEWDEATRYEEFKKIGKDKWIQLVSKGKVVEYNTKTVQKMSNTDAVNVKDFDNLDKNKQGRALKQLEKGSIELPIVASYSDGHLELVGGNTRLTAVMKATGKGKVWQFDVPDKVAKLAEEKTKPAKPRDPNFQTMVDIKKSGAGGAHRDKKKEFKQGKEKHKKNYARTDEVTAKDLAKESEIYVDMDGVLADFFGAWKKLIGTDWREIKDLDSALQKIRDKDDFWLKIPVTKNAMNLLSLIKGLKGKYNILSAPLPNDPNSEPHKREWIKKNLSAFPPSKVIITSNKAVHATQPDGTPNILIDDFGQNIAKWEAAGGVGFKHKDHKFERTVKNLKQHMSEAKMSKSSIKKIHKTADKIKDKPKAKKSISNWAKERGMDPEGAIYAIATNMRKRKEGKKITGLGKESYTRDELPQIKAKHLENFPHVIEYVNPRHLVPVQKERLKENHTDQLLKILEGRYTPIVVDWDYKIINGHHRYDIVKKLQMEQISVARLPFTLEEILENFADGKKKGKSRPGRVKRSGASCKGSVTSLRAKAKKASGERAKMYHWCANMKSGRKKSESYTREQFYNILVESTPQQLEEGIKDQLAKLPKNMLAKVQPIIKKIPKTGKSLVLIATLLGVMVNAVAAGDMAKADAQVDKLNNMTTMSTTADAPTKADKGGFDLDDVNYDRNYKGDVNKVFKVQDTSVKDAKAMYDKLGGVSGDNFEKMSKIVYDKIDDLRSDYQDAVKKKGLSGKDALQSDEFKDFRKQSNDLKIMLSKAMEIMTKDAGATGSILKPTGKILGKG